jgi:hypothetical protein
VAEPARQRQLRKASRILAAIAVLLAVATAYGTASRPGVHATRAKEEASSGSAPFSGSDGRPPPFVPPARSGTVPISSSLGHPARIAIPAVGIDTSLQMLGLEPDGSLQVPSDFNQAGWWEGGPLPGDPGPAVIVGHVDSSMGPAVFFRLRELKPGDLIAVWRGDGAELTFVVQRTEEVPKVSFPTEQVYGALRYPALRLITCGGRFDFHSGHYIDNVIVFASMSASGRLAGQEAFLRAGATRGNPR